MILYEEYMGEDKKKTSIITQKDILILKQLLEDGRKSSASISKEIDLGREIVNYRIKRLIKENLIVKFVPKLNEKALHYQEYIILLKLNLDDELSKEQFVKETIGNKYLVWVLKSQNGWDLIVRLYAQSVEEFKEKLSEILELFSDVLANYYTIISSDELKEGEEQILSKNLFSEMEKKEDFEIIKEQESAQLPSLDSKDKEILHLLEENGRIQFREIAQHLEVSSDTVKYRIEKMKEQGIIENFVPVINFSKLGLYQFAGILQFSYLSKEEYESINSFLTSHEQITRAIKSLNSEEIFLTVVFEDKEYIEEFREELKQLFGEKLIRQEFFEVD